jgi:transcriptional antiterminator RfaH
MAALSSPAAAKPPEPAWYCLRAQPKHEAIAAAQLRQLAEIEVFCPRLRFERPRRARAGYADPGRVWVTEALFPGYLFARFDVLTRHREIQHAHGIRGIVRFGETFHPVPEALIEQLRASVQNTDEDNGANGATADDVTITVAPEPQPGQEIIVAAGPFAGLRALVTRYLPARQRVLVLLEFLGREMEAEVSAERVVSPVVAHPLRRVPGS